MSNTDICVGKKVKNVKTNLVGVVVSDPYGCCDSHEVPVVYEGTTAFLGTDINILKELEDESPKADLIGCGAGKGKDCCIFLTVGKDGPECQRFTSLRNTLIFKKEKMNAQREPTEMYPKCMTWIKNL